ncbi:hypothetical protein D9M71_677070 [compost metagenome]
MGFVSAQFDDQFNFDAGASWNLRHTECTPGVFARLTEDFLKQIGKAIGDDMVVGVLRGAVHQAQHFDDAGNT